MLKFKRKDTCPPGDWKFKDPSSGVTLRGGDYGDLWKKVKEHRLANGFPPITEAEFQDIICRALPPGSTNCRAYDPDLERSTAVPKPPHLDSAITFIRFLKESISRGAGFVPQEEANRRAAICAACPNNLPLDGCSSCRGILRWVTETIGQRTTPEDNRLKGCAVCGCENRVSVHCDLEAQRKAIPESVRDQFPPFCWKASV